MVSRLFAPVLAFALAGAASAQSFPSKPLRLICPFPPAGAVDIASRATAHELTKILGQTVAVENRPGAGGNLGTDLAAKSPPDGYTLLMSPSSIAIAPALYSKLPYDPVKDFAPVTLVTSVPNVLVVHPSVPAKSVRELIALAKTRKGELNFASGSTGSAGHLAGELFKTMAGVDMVHIPYKGAAPAVTDLLAGHVSLMFDNLASGLPNIKAGRARALAVTTMKRSPFLPELPTISESGLRGFDIGTWFGVFAPAGTPREIVMRLNAEISRALKTPVMKERLATLGAEAMPNTPEAFGAFVKAEMAKYREIVRASGAKVD
jgi:tripartite-type tricarboxylate transporter receptor subunit TctC